jgi:hypothetical protein
MPTQSYRGTFETFIHIKSVAIDPKFLGYRSIVVCFLCQTRVIPPLKSNRNEVVPPVWLEVQVSASHRTYELDSTYTRFHLSSIVYESTVHPANGEIPGIGSPGTEVKLDEMKRFDCTLALRRHRISFLVHFSNASPGRRSFLVLQGIHLVPANIAPNFLDEEGSLWKLDKVVFVPVGFFVSLTPDAS